MSLRGMHSTHRYSTEAISLPLMLFLVKILFFTN